MAGFIIRRICLGVLSLFGASVLVFVMMSVVGGDVVLETVLGSEGGMKIPQKTLDEAHAKLGLDKPPVARYIDWIRKLSNGTLGYSYSEKSTVGELIKRRIQPTFQLAIQSVIFAWLLGLPLGILAAIRRNTMGDYASRLISVLGLCLPTFWIGLLVTWIMSVHFGWFPPLEQHSFWTEPWISFQQTLIPSMVLSLFMGAYVARMTRSSMLEILREDYVRTARAKGLRDRLIVMRHVLKVAILPVMTLSGVHFGHLLGGTVVIEEIFGIDGLGGMTIQAVIKRDTIVVQNVVVFMTLMFVMVNIVVDLAYAWLDPRIHRSA